MTSEAYESLREKGYLLAGELGDMRQRACVYHQMYQDSGGRNVFPLIAAHIALWASDYFRKGMLAGKLLSLPYLCIPGARSIKLRRLSTFADEFKDINRRVCAESYAIYHYMKRHGDSSFIRSVIGDELADILLECHLSAASQTCFPEHKRAKLFHAFFSWEQQNIVSPSVAKAFAQMDWAPIRYLALRPKIQFAYFGKGYHMQFADFSSCEERAARGIQAYRRAEQVGLDQVEHALGLHKSMPRNSVITMCHGPASAPFPAPAR